MKVSTKASKPVAPPKSFTGKYLDSRRIEVTWLPPDQDTQRGRIISYKIYYQPNDQEGVEPLVVTADGDSRRYILRDLSTWTEYKIWMVASTGVGDGRFHPDTEREIFRELNAYIENEAKISFLLRLHFAFFKFSLRDPIFVSNLVTLINKIE